MSYQLEYTGQFKRDIKLAQKRGLNLAHFKDALVILEKDGKLPSKYKPHTLSGNWRGYWECHIQPDWLLIWKKEESIKLITLIRTGSHSDLF
jgi:mRNA interferase YafQ